MANTSFINRIAFHATEQTAAPSIPNLGSNVASFAGWTVLGSRDAGEDADLDGGDVQVTLRNEHGEVRPPRSLTAEEYITFANGAEMVSFTAYDGSESLLAIDSGISQTSHVSQMIGTTTYRTMCIEVNGKWLDYLPKVKVTVVSSGGGYTGEPVKTTFECKVCGTKTVNGDSTNIPGGIARYHYQAA